MARPGSNTHRATGAAAIASTLTATRPLVITSVRLHLSAAGGAVEDFTVTIDGGVTADVYDTVLFSQDMTLVQDILWVPDHPITISKGDEVDFAYNNGNTRTYGLEVVYQFEGVA